MLNEIVKIDIEYQRAWRHIISILIIRHLYSSFNLQHIFNVLSKLICIISYIANRLKELCLKYFVSGFGSYIGLSKMALLYW